jgi:hypothetical protein
LFKTRKVKARHLDTSTNKLYNDPHEPSLACAAIAFNYDGNEENSSFSTINVKENFVTKKKSGFESFVENDLVLQAPASITTATLPGEPVLSTPVIPASVVQEAPLVLAPVAQAPPASGSKISGHKCFLVVRGF